MARKVLVSFVGRQGAGKSTIAAGLADVLRTGHIEVSDVVKDLYNDLPRELLPSTGRRTESEPDWLGKAVHKALIEKAEIWERDLLVLSGVREQAVHEYLGKQFDLYSFEIVADPEIRFQRLSVLWKVRSGKEFIEHEIRETGLGVQEVMDKAPFRIPTSQETQPDYIVKAIIRALSVKGVKL